MLGFENPRFSSVVYISAAISVQTESKRDSWGAGRYIWACNFRRYTGSCLGVLSNCVIFIWRNHRFWRKSTILIKTYAVAKGINEFLHRKVHSRLACNEMIIVVWLYYGPLLQAAATELTQQGIVFVMQLVVNWAACRIVEYFTAFVFNPL